jgi:hypothetical protein
VVLPIEIRLRQDAAPSIFIENEVEEIISTTYRQDLPPLRVLTFIPVRTDIDPRAANISYVELSQAGMAAVLRTPSAEIPRVDIFRKKLTSPVREIAAKYGWTVAEMENAEFANVPLEREYADTARRAIAEQVSDIAVNGHPSTQLPGMLTNPNIPRLTVAVGASMDTKWSTKTADEILRDLGAMFASVVETSLGAYTVDSGLLPMAQYNQIADMPRSSISDETVLSYFLRTNPYCKQINWLAELAGAGTGGSDIMIAYPNDPIVWAYWMVMPFEQRPQQERDLQVEVVCREKSGGVIIPKPIALVIAEGI